VTFALGVAAAGGAGALCRYLVDGAIQQRRRGPFPMGTLVVNLSGALVLGLVVGLAGSRPGGLAEARTLLGAGFDGGFTTFSTLMFETAALLRDGARRYALGNLLANLLGSLLAVAAGLAVGRAL
jgi:CrcB protein